MNSWLFSSPSPAKKGGKWEGWVWHSHERPVHRDDFYRSPAWRAIRDAEFAANKRWYGRATPTCERCGAWRTKMFVWKWPFFVEREWHGDHIEPRSLFPEKELDPENCQVLCEVCNVTKSNRNCIDWKGYRRWPFRLGYPVVWVRVWHQRMFLGWSC